jgi:hypothetical protein
MPTVEESPCPQCGELETMRLEIKLVATPIGAFSLAGVQMKVSARQRPVLTCTHCELFLIGEYEPDGRHVVFDSPRAAPEADETD